MRLRQKSKNTFSEERVIPPRIGLLWLLGAVVLVLSPHLLRQPLWLSLFCLAVLGWRGFQLLRNWPAVNKWIRIFFTFAGFIAVLRSYGTITGRDAGLALLTVMLCLKLLEMKTQRDTMLVIFIGYFLVIGQFLYDQAIFIGLYLFLAVLVLTTALIFLNHPGSQRSHWRYNIKTAGGMLLQAMPMMVLLFILFPRIPGPLWGLPNQETMGRTGLSDEMSLGSITNLVNSEEIAFRAAFETDIPPANQLYWRGPVLWHTTGRHWRGIAETDPLTQRPPPDFTASGEASLYTVTLEPHDKRWLFALDLPASISIAARSRVDYQLLATKKVTELTRYQASSYLQYQVSSLAPDLETIALHLPLRANPRTRQLAQEWRQKGLSTNEIVTRAMAYISEGNFFYTRQPPALTGPNPVDSFLFDTKRGFCEHYAASFTTLMRAAGIPARVITGYQGGELNTQGNYLLVRQSDAHAWSEVWLDDRGWVRIDPTSLIPVENVETTIDASRFRSTLAKSLRYGDISWLTRGLSQMRQNWDAVNHAWNQWILGYGPETQDEFLTKLGLGKMNWQQIIALMFGLIILVLLPVAAYLLLRQAPATDPVNRLYQRFCQQLAKRGLPLKPGEGPVDYANRIITAQPEWASPVQQITALYTALRYAKVSHHEQFLELKNRVADFKP